MATPGPDGTDYVAFTAHIWVNKSTGQVQIASADPELNFIDVLSKKSANDAVAREFLRKHGKPSTRR